MYNNRKINNDTNNRKNRKRQPQNDIIQLL